MGKRVAILTVVIEFGLLVMAGAALGLAVAGPGDWVRYRILQASEGVPAAVDALTITIGAPERLQGADLIWWQMVGEKPDGKKFAVQALAERAPMTAEGGDIGVVFAYRFQHEGCPALEYVDAKTGLAYLPIFGFRDGLIPTPRSNKRTTGAFMNAGNYLGQALTPQDSGSGGEWLDLGPITKIALDDDVLIGTARMFKDDGTGSGDDKEYKYVELSSEDYDQMIDTGFNLFMVDNKHAAYVRERGVFFVKAYFGDDPYPELLYRSNYWGTAMFTDEPAVRMDASMCTSVHEAANLIRLRNYAFHLAPWSHADAVLRNIYGVGFNTGDWNPRQLHIPVWETMYESAFYQMQGGAAGMVHEGRYQLSTFNDMMRYILGPGAEVDKREMFDLVYAFMRGAARCLRKEWGMAIYGQCDYALAPDAIRQAYDAGAHYVWFWTSDHDHHLPFTKQLELARITREYQKQQPRTSRLPQLREARVAVAVPEGYVCGWGNMWWTNTFSMDKRNELGVPLGRINAEAYFQMLRLARQNTPFDCIVDVPEVIDAAGYDRIIRIGPDGRTNLPSPVMPSKPPRIVVRRIGKAEPGKPSLVTAERSVVRKGEDIILRVYAAASAPCDAELSIRFRHDDAVAPAALAKIALTTEPVTLRLRLPTGDLESESYDLELTLRAAGQYPIDQTIRTYILP